MKLQDLQTLKERLPFDLNKYLLIFAIILFFFSSYIANYNTTINEAWIRWKFIMYFDFILIYYTLQNEVKKLITDFGYKIVVYLLINYFIDRYFGLNGWSWNDFFTIILIAIEYKFKNNARR